MTEDNQLNKNKQVKFRDDSPQRFVPRFSSVLLFNLQGNLIIEHQGDEYVLRITRSGKLILTK